MSRGIYKNQERKRFREDRRSNGSDERASFSANFLSHPLVSRLTLISFRFLRLFDEREPIPHMIACTENKIALLGTACPLPVLDNAFRVTLECSCSRKRLLLLSFPKRTGFTRRVASTDSFNLVVRRRRANFPGISRYRVTFVYRHTDSIQPF